MVVTELFISLTFFSVSEINHEKREYGIFFSTRDWLFQPTGGEVR
jgi:hypothetical protein